VHGGRVERGGRDSSSDEETLSGYQDEEVTVVRRRRRRRGGGAESEGEEEMDTYFVVHLIRAGEIVCAVRDKRIHASHPHNQHERTKNTHYTCVCARAPSHLIKLVPESIAERINVDERCVLIFVLSLPGCSSAAHERREQ
jgi:hypothetical protein